MPQAITISAEFVALAETSRASHGLRSALAERFSDRGMPSRELPDIGARLRRQLAASASICLFLVSRPLTTIVPSFFSRIANIYDWASSKMMNCAIIRELLAFVIYLNCDHATECFHRIDCFGDPPACALAYVLGR